MDAATRAGRIIGVLMILQMAGSGLVNFVLVGPVFDDPESLANVASHSRQMGIAVLLGLTIQALWLGIAVTALPILLQRARTLMLWFVALAVVSIAVVVVENVDVMSIVSLGEGYARASAAEREQLETVQIVVASGRNWAHYLGRILDGCMAFVFYAALYRVALIPRALAGFGLVAAPLMVTGLAMPLFGRDVVFPMLAPLGLSQVTLALWLLTKGLGPSGETPT
jgi:Domain of unknown function (DUF4386)